MNILGAGAAAGAPAGAAGGSRDTPNGIETGTGLGQDLLMVEAGMRLCISFQKWCIFEF